MNPGTTDLTSLPSTTCDRSTRDRFVAAVSRFSPTKLRHFCAPAWVGGGGAVGSFVLTVCGFSVFPAALEPFSPPTLLGQWGLLGFHALGGA